MGKNPPPEPVRKSRRGRPRVYPPAEMAVACILMNHSNISSNDAKSAAASWNLDLDGRVPSTSTILRAHEELDMQWLQDMMAATAKACLEKAGIGEAAEVGSAADSTGVETDRCEDRAKLDKKTGRDRRARKIVPEMAHFRGAESADNPLVRDDAEQRGRHRRAAAASRKIEKTGAQFRRLVVPRRQGVRFGQQLRGRLRHGHAPQHPAEEEQGERRQQARCRQALPAQGRGHVRRGALRKAQDGGGHIRGRGDALPPAALPVQEKGDAGEVRRAARDNVERARAQPDPARRGAGRHAGRSVRTGRAGKAPRRIRPPRLPPSPQNDGIRHFGRFAGEL